MRDLFAAAAIAAVAITRFLTRSHRLYDLDSVNFALGMRRFDPASHQPHPPGYYLYIRLGRLLHPVLPDPNSALVAISILASCAAAWMIYRLTREWFGMGPARLSLVFFLFSPLGWFHGTVALTYMVEAFFSAAIGYLCWRGHAVRASAVFALAAGFRPSSALLLAPLWLLTIWRARGRWRWCSVGIAALTLAAWAVPMVREAGGAGVYLESFRHLWMTVPGRRTTLASPWLAVARIVTVAWILVLCFGTASLLVFRPRKPAGQFVWVWITPGLLFFSFVFLNFVNSGYLLVITPPLFALLADRAWEFLSAPRHRAFRWMSAALAMALNSVFFLYGPLYCCYRSVQHFESSLASIVQDIQSSGLDPQRTLVIGFDSHFLGYRHAGFYLPDFVTAQYPEVGYPEGKRLFVMDHQDTRVVREFPIHRFERFILFPLPEGAQYAEYLDTVVSQLPAGTLGTLPIGARKVLVGPASAVPLLFPHTARQSAAETGAVRNSGRP